MQFFELIVIERAARRVLTRLPPARAAWGPFHRGELFRFEGRYFPIDQVVNQVTDRGSATLSTTVLLLGPVLPDSAFGDVTFPEAAALPELAAFPEANPPADEGPRRGWWRR